jgi:hypothetical protein
MQSTVAVGRDGWPGPNVVHVVRAPHDGHELLCVTFVVCPGRLDAGQVYRSVERNARNAHPRCSATGVQEACLQCQLWSHFQTAGHAVLLYTKATNPRQMRTQHSHTMNISTSSVLQHRRMHIQACQQQPHS